MRKACKMHVRDTVGLDTLNVFVIASAFVFVAEFAFVSVVVSAFVSVKKGSGELFFCESIKIVEINIIEIAKLSEVGELVLIIIIACR
jgi:hypothetical protein